MSVSREGLGFWGKREEAISEIQKTFFALSDKMIGYGVLTGTTDPAYNTLVDRLEELVIEGSEEELLRWYGGREEGM